MASYGSFLEQAILRLVIPTGGHIGWNTSSDLVPISSICSILLPLMTRLYLIILTKPAVNLSKFGKSIEKDLYYLDQRENSSHRTHPRWCYQGWRVILNLQIGFKHSR
ncbi:hypothetical protein BDZ89DRAFT_694284 [Hymenopellis radicata]|nr:hypothetical protein BDZ89DRAFT_694284 [Hymenopellis radicata]